MTVTTENDELLPLSRTPVVKSEEFSSIELTPLCAQLGLVFFTHPYKKTSTSDGTPRWFVHERGEETGLSFGVKRDMAEAVMRFSMRRALDRRASLIAWGGQQGFLVLTVLSDEQRRAKDSKDASRARADKAEKA